MAVLLPCLQTRTLESTVAQRRDVLLSDVPARVWLESSSGDIATPGITLLAAFHVSDAKHL